VNIELADAFLDAFVRLAKNSACDRVLLIGAKDLPLDRLKILKKKLLLADEHAHVVDELRAEGFEAVALPGQTSGRMDRLKAALVGAVGSGHLTKGENVLCAMTTDQSAIDTLLHLTAGEIDDEESSSMAVTQLASDVPVQLLEVLVDLALRIGREGYEGRPLGSLFVVGDSTPVMEMSHPLTLNPFQGYSEAERNLFDPHVRDAVRTFAMLDGAYVVRDDGVVLAAGRHIRVGDSKVDVPLGLGARHTAAASISAETEAIAIVVSQSSGAVRVYQNGKIVLEITPSGRRGDDRDDLVFPGSKKKTPAKKKAAKKKTEKKTEKKTAARKKTG
jgi:DNA integrity scanning protein DisA with diadenylate cyclase activity